MKHLPWKELGWASLAVVALVVLYVGAYFAMIDGIKADPWADPTLGDEVRIAPEFRFGGETADNFFRPAYSMDVVIRPSRWPKVKCDVRSVVEQ